MNINISILSSYKRLNISLTILILSIALTIGNIGDAIAQNQGTSKSQTLINLANAQFDLEYYQNASEFYEKALAIDVSNVRINYRYAECMRHLFQYDVAKEYYKKASEIDLKNYPMSLFYNALMLKLTGNYDGAIGVFDEFLNKTKYIAVEKFDNKKAIFERTLIEMEGCYWAMEQLFDTRCTVLPIPVNSEYIDFAPQIFENDSSILVSSGEGFTDNYLFSKVDSSWQLSKMNNNFDIINSKFNEGQGVFNQHKDTYYFTSCGREDSYCKIYVTKLVEGKWTKPNLLNETVNQENSDNKHPSLSAYGDTLYFASNRIGGFGMNDLWFSVLSGDGENWGEAQNLGNKINTPFNEVSPFVFHKKNLLYFASDGHKGLGGFDIFIAKLNNTSTTPITNISIPYNSSSDDLYFILGDEKGYLSSNRKGGFGKFDIYGFNNMFRKSKHADYEDKLAALSNEISNLSYEAVTFSPDLPEEIISKDVQKTYDNIMSIKKAAMIYDIVLLFPESDYYNYEDLSIDDKSIIDMIYFSFVNDISLEEIDSIKQLDNDLFQNISENEKEFISELADSYKETSAGASFIKLKNKAAKKYSALHIDKKEQTDRFVAMLLNESVIRKSELSVIEAIYTDEINILEIADSSGIISNEDYINYEKILSIKTAAALYGLEMQLNSLDSSTYQNFSIDDLSLIEMSFQSRLKNVNQSYLDSLKMLDKNLYDNLNEPAKSYVNNIAQNYFISSKDTSEIVLSDDENKFYKGLNINEKREIDRLVAYKLYEHTKPLTIDSLYELDFIDNSIVSVKKQNDYQKLLSMLYAAEIYDMSLLFVEPDFSLFKSLSLDDKSLVDKLFLLKKSSLTEVRKKEIQDINVQFYADLKDDEKEIINRIAQSYSEILPYSLFVQLDENDFEYYSNLGLDKKKITDRLIVYRIDEINRDKEKIIGNYEDILIDELGLMSISEDGGLINEAEIELFERLLSLKISCHIYDIELPFIEQDYLNYSGLSVEQLSILDMMFLAKTFSFYNDDVLKSVHEADKKQYESTSENEKGLIDRIVNAYLLSPENADFIKINKNDSITFAEINIRKLYIINRLFVYRLKKILSKDVDDLTPEDYIYKDVLNIENLVGSDGFIEEEEYATYEKLLSFKVACGIYDLELPFIQSDFEIHKNLSFDENSILLMLFEIKKIGLKEKKVAENLQREDKQNIENLSAENKNFVNRIVNAGINISELNQYTKLSEADSLKYVLLAIEEKQNIDRMVVHEISQLLNAYKTTEKINSTFKNDDLNIESLADATQIITKAESNSYLKILSTKLASFIYNIKILPIKSDFELYKQMTIDDLSLLDMMFELKKSNLNNKETIDSVQQADKILNTQLTEKESNFITYTIEKYAAVDEISTFISLDGEKKAWYGNLKIVDKFKIDRILAFNIRELLNRKNINTSIEKKTKSDVFSASLQELSADDVIISNSEYRQYERILSVQLAGYIHGLDLPFIESDHKIVEKFTIDDYSLVDMMYLMRKGQIQDKEVLQALRQADNTNYGNLTAQDKEFVERIVSRFVNFDKQTEFIEISKEDEIRYNNLTIDKKNEFDRFIALKLSGLIFNNLQTEAITNRTDTTIINNTVFASKSVNLFFDVNGYEISSEYKKVLDLFIINNSIDRNSKITINAFADETGSDAYNKKLSYRRGEMVKAYLVNNKTNHKNITINSFGEKSNSENVRSNSLRRRVEVILE